MAGHPATASAAVWIGRLQESRPVLRMWAMMRDRRVAKVVVLVIIAACMSWALGVPDELPQQDTIGSPGSLSTCAFGSDGNGTESDDPGFPNGSGDEKKPSASLGVAVGSAAVFGVTGSLAAEDVNSDGEQDIKVQVVGTSIVDDGDPGFDVLLGRSEGRWEGELSTSEGSVRVGLSSVDSTTDADVFTYDITNLGYEGNGEGICSITIPLGGAVDPEVLELVELPPGWEMSSALGSLGGFITFAPTGGSEGAKVGETVRVSFSLPRQRPPEGPLGKREMPSPPGFLLGATPLEVGLVNILREENLGGAWLRDWLRGGTAPPSREIPGEKVVCEDWMPNYFVLPSGQGICVRGYMAVAPDETAMALEVTGEDQGPHAQSIAGGVMVACPIRPGSEPRPDPPLPKGWSLTAPSQVEVSPGLGVFTGSMDPPTLGQGLFLPLRWGVKRP